MSVVVAGLLDVWSFSSRHASILSSRSSRLSLGSPIFLRSLTILALMSDPTTCTDRFPDNKAKAARNSGALFLQTMAAPSGMLDATMSGNTSYLPPSLIHLKVGLRHRAASTMALGHLKLTLNGYSTILNLAFISSDPPTAAPRK